MFSSICHQCSHIAVPALDGLADHRRRDLVGDLDVPHFALEFLDMEQEPAGSFEQHDLALAALPARRGAVVIAISALLA